MKKRRFNRIEREILKVLYFHRRPMSILELSEKSYTSWTTAKKYVARLIKRGIIKKNSSKVIFNFDILKKR